VVDDDLFDVVLAILRAGVADSDLLTVVARKFVEVGF